MSEIVEKIQKASLDRLTQMTIGVIKDSERQIVDAIGDFKSLSQQTDEILDRFMKNMTDNFDELMDREFLKDEAVFNFETLSLVQEEELEVIVALEGMVNYARNEHLPVFISFNTRLSSLFPRKRIDESTNPLDPEQVATAFQEALRPLGLDAQDSLSIYRAFNKGVLRHLDQVLNEANGILVESSVIPDLGMEAPGKSRPPPARNRPRTEASMFGTVEEEAFDDDVEERPELFSIMQNLLHTDTPMTPPPGGSPAGPATGGAPGFVGGQAPAGGQATTGQIMGAPGEVMIPASMIPAAMMPMVEGAMQQQETAAGSPGGTAPAMQPFQPQEGQVVQTVDQAKLMEILTNIQEKLTAAAPAAVPGAIEDVEKLDISQSLGEFLVDSQEDENVVNAVDRQSSDIINLVTLLYEAIWQDPSVPIPIKELIGRTQITIIKVALADVEFFNNENHPARAILNEFAAAGIGWTEVEELEKDPMYLKMQELVERIFTEYQGENALFIELIDDFREFRAQEAAKTRQLEQRILKAEERKERLDDIHELVDQKIAERILGRELHPFVEELLKDPFHKFMVMLVLKEGPGGNAWKQAINTIDVLLWSVQPHEEGGDRDRLQTVNPRLMNNLRKAFRIAGVEKAEIDELIAQLEQVQGETFHGLEESVEAESAAPDADDAAASTDESDEPDSASEGEQNTTDEPDEAEKPDTAVAVRFLAAGEDEEDQSPQSEPAEAEPAEEQESTVVSDAGTTVEPKDQNEVEATDLIDVPTTETESPGDASADEATADTPPTRSPEEAPLADDDPNMMQVDRLSVGVWVEFAGEDDNNTRCKLAAKINAIDKYIFVNRQGVKVVEKTKLGLARELRDGTVSIISDGLLFSRALESVIGNLRDSQHEQQTGSAYQPAESEEG